MIWFGYGKHENIRYPKCFKFKFNFLTYLQHTLDCCTSTKLYSPRHQDSEINKTICHWHDTGKQLWWPGTASLSQNTSRTWSGPGWLAGDHPATDSQEGGSCRGVHCLMIILHIVEPHKSWNLLRSYLLSISNGYLDYPNHLIFWESHSWSYESRMSIMYSNLISNIAPFTTS